MKKTIIAVVIAVICMAAAFAQGTRMHSAGATDWAGLGVLLYVLPYGGGLSLIGMIIGALFDSGKTVYVFLVVGLMTLALTTGCFVTA
jgi:hypothetical protein